MTVAAGDGAALAAVVHRFARDGVRTRTLGENARRIFDRDHDKRLVIELWARLIETVAGNGPPHQV